MADGFSNSLQWAISTDAGRANGDNRIAIIIPCHRVIRSDGKLCGYGGGLWRKQFLLDHEREVSAMARSASLGHLSPSSQRQEPIHHPLPQRNEPVAHGPVVYCH
ncbi:MAG: MGMT family protein [Planctomycetes bacterium]|nr:MGMT family protein [Planctomycetota bacterium]